MLLDDLRGIISDQRVQNTLGILNQTRISFSDFVKKPTAYNFASGCVALGATMMDHLRIDPVKFFKGWVLLEDYSRNLFDLTQDLIAGAPTTVYTTNTHNVIVVRHLPGFDLGSNPNPNSQNNAYYVRATHKKIAEDYFRSLVWTKYGNKSLTLSCGTNPIPGNGISLEEDTREYKASPLAKKLVGEFELFKNAGVTRSAIFYGRPGSGKSTLMRAIACDLKLRCLSIGVNELARVGTGTGMGTGSGLLVLLNILKPDAILIDDLDRLVNNSSLLEFIERLYLRVRFIFATANDTSNLDEALIRPQRFDLLIEVECLDREVVEQVLGEFSDQYEFVKTWPMSFVVEFATRCKVQGPFVAKKSMIELSTRVAEISHRSRHTDLQLVSSAGGE